MALVHGGLSMTEDSVFSTPELVALDRKLNRIRSWAMLDDETKWLIMWTVIIGAAGVVEAVALRSGKVHAPLSHHLRRLPAGSPWGKAALLAGAWALHRHLWKEAKR